jgi:3-isopropylmalate/(R)-2-methylmalate dehydratase small subunit
VILTGKVWKFGDHVDTDAIIPARYLNRSHGEELAAHCMEDIEPDFASQVERGDIVVAGENFGCGSSREHAPIALKACGVSCVVAASFARIFYRNAINCGLPILDCPEAAADAQSGDVLMVNLMRGTVHNQRSGRDYAAAAFPGLVMEIIQAGGLVPLTQQRLQARRATGACPPTESEI